MNGIVKTSLCVAERRNKAEVSLALYESPCALSVSLCDCEWALSCLLRVMGFVRTASESLTFIQTK